MKTKTLSLLSLLLLGMAACKKEPEPTPPPNYGTPHKMTLGVKVNVSSTNADGIKSVRINYDKAHGAFTHEKQYSNTPNPYPQTWDTTFTAYPDGEIVYTVHVNSYNLKMYWTDDYKKGDTTFLAAQPGKENTMTIKVKD